MNTRLLAALAVSFTAVLLAPEARTQVASHKELTYPPLHQFSIPRPERVVLDNGMVVLLVEDHELPLIDGAARIRAGDRLDPTGKVGLATLVADVMRTGGTKTMTGDQVDEFLETRAAEIEISATADAAVATFSCLAPDFPQVLKVFAEILRAPAFAEEKLEIARNEINAGISRRNDQPGGIVEREFARLIYGADSPYAAVLEYASVAAITHEDLVSFHRKNYQPERIVLAFAGDFAAKEMAATLRAAFKSWPRGAGLKDSEAVIQPSVKPGVYQVVKEDMTQSEIVMGHLGIRRDNPDYFAVEVLNEVLGGGFSARLFSNVRSRKGLAYRVRGGVGSSYDYPGAFRVSMSTKTGTTAAGIDALMEEIDGIVSRPPSEDEMSRAKEAILNSFIFNFDSPEKVLGQQVTYEYFGFPADFLVKYREGIEKVTVADLTRVAKKYIHKDQMAMLVVGPAAGQDRPLSSFGKVTALDITIPEMKSTLTAPTASIATPDSVAKGKAILARMVVALGGEAAVDAVKATRSTSSGSRRTPQGEMNTKVIQTVAYPDRLRQELSLPMGEIVVVLSGNTGFVLTPMGTQPLPDSQRGEVARALKRQAIALAQRRGDPLVTVQHVGIEEVSGAKADVLLLTVDGEESRLFVDQATGRVVRQIYAGSAQAGPGEFSVTYSDFRPVAGDLTLPFHIETNFNGELQSSSTVEEIVINPEVTATLFARPEAAEGGGGNPGGRI